GGVTQEWGGPVFVDRVRGEIALPPDPADLLGDVEWDRDVFADPRGHIADLAYRLDEQVVLLEIDKPPRGAAHDEALPELRVLGDEPFVQGADRATRRQVDHPVRLHVRDHRDVLEEVREGVGTPTEAAIAGPEDPEARELGDDLIEVRPLQFPERPAPA